MYKKRCREVQAEEGSREEEVFCNLFGPEQILSKLDEFLGHFMIRKVMASEVTVHAAGTVTKNLAKWLHENGYVPYGRYEQAAKRTARAARDLPEAEELTWALNDFAENHIPEGNEETEEVFESHFIMSRVECRRVWLKSLLGEKDLGVVTLSESLTRRCVQGWEFSGIVTRTPGNTAKSP